MKIIKRIGGRDYKVTYSPVPAHLLPKKTKPAESSSDVSNDLSDVTFMIPIKLESNDRKRCLTIVLDYMLKYFPSTNVIICEEGPNSIFPSIKKPSWEKAVKYIYRKTNSEIFHKTVNLNTMAKAATTKIIAACDSDVLFKPQQYKEAAIKIRTEQLDFCYPFNQPNYNIQKTLHSTLEATLDLFCFESEVKFTHPSPPPGGCFFMNKAKFMEGGMENENFISWGPEDQERRDRMIILDYKVGAVSGKLFHIDHDRTSNSHSSNEFFDRNVQEYEKVKLMNRNQLKNYISTWKWTK
jgi:predicted glycosyltransferase involved in capsule biosynthesis